MSEAQALEAKATQLLREAQKHKSASRFHRDRAREKREALARVMALAKARGIEITINAKPDLGGHSGNNNGSTSS
jgi:phosphotransferase system HPr-like phosphotransfer protein